MKAPPGLSFTLAALVLLCASLGAGQVWAMTGSTGLGLATGAALGLGLGAAVRPLLRRVGIGRRVLGEYRGALDEDEFVEVVEEAGAAAGPRGAIQRGVSERPERVASSIRSLLVGCEARSGGAGRRERKGKK